MQLSAEAWVQSLVLGWGVKNSRFLDVDENFTVIIFEQLYWFHS